MSTVRLIVRGRVQGVFYRHSTRHHANSLVLSGWVRNLPDGTVELEATGSKDVLESLIEWCHGGPPSAIVEQVEVVWFDSPEDENRHFGVFTVR